MLAPLRLKGDRRLQMGPPVLLMGVVNVTPDSFSDGGEFFDPDAGVRRGLELMEHGAHILDVGGESTRPGSDPVSPEEQIRRVVPVIAGLRAASQVPISVDTTSAVVAQSALDAGADMVNDISAFRFDDQMLSCIVEAGVPAIAMHTLAPPKTMQRDVSYADDDVVSAVVDHLAARRDAFVGAGGDPTQLVLDPGIGFGKTVEHNLALLRDLPRLVALGCPVLVGTSRKSFLGAITGKPVDQRGPATAASVAIAVARGAHIVRVHDVAEVQDAVAVGAAICYLPAP